MTARKDASAGDASPMAHRIREILRAHTGCHACGLGELRVEEIQVILDLAGRDTAEVEAERDTALANLRDRRAAGQVAAEAAARIDAAYSHGVPSGPGDPVTADDWDRLLRYARCGGSERVL